MPIREGVLPSNTHILITYYTTIVKIVIKLLKRILEIMCENPIHEILGSAATVGGTVAHPTTATERGMEISSPNDHSHLFGRPSNARGLEVDSSVFKMYC